MKVAILSSIAWRTPPVHYGPWEQTTSMLTEGLVSRGVDVTLFATSNSQTMAKLISVCPRGYEEDLSLNPKVWECLHISELFDCADRFDLVHNNFDFLPLTYTAGIKTPLLTTIHGFSSKAILPVYKKYDASTYYVSISNADRSPELTYIETIYHGLDLSSFTMREDKEDYLLFFGRIHPDKGTKEAIDISRKAGRKLIIAGIIQDKNYFEGYVKPFIDGKMVDYIGAQEPSRRDILMGNAAALLHPINFDEPFGLSVIESMACGTPVIAFNRGSMPELIKDRETGFLVSSVEEAVSSISMLDKIEPSVCRKRVEERFTKEKMVERYLSVYKRIINLSKGDGMRPWGQYTILSDEPSHKVKRIVVNTKSRLSLQSHKRRAEHWYIIDGSGEVTIDNDIIPVYSGVSVNIPKKARHRINNTGELPLTFIEVQTGDYFGEDDIERYEDDYGRGIKSE